jgi:hypothetical protein
MQSYRIYVTVAGKRMRPLFVGVKARPVAMLQRQETKRHYIEKCLIEKTQTWQKVKTSIRQNKRV